MSYQSALAVPCPAETALLGASIDGSSDEYMTYFAVLDDDSAQLVSMQACFQDGLFGVKREHFRGFRP